MGFVSVRGTSGTEPRPCHKSCGELGFLPPTLIWVAQSRHCIQFVCVAGNVIYSLVAFDFMNRYTVEWIHNDRCSLRV